MKEIPILLSTDMVQATLRGNKNVTRRLSGLEAINEDPDNWEFVRFYNGYAKFCERHNHLNERYIKCRYGKEGPLLWVRETWAYTAPLTEIFSGRRITNVVYKAGRMGLTYPHRTAEGKLDITQPHTELTDAFDNHALGGKWKPSIHLKKEHARIWLRNTGVRVERLHDITRQEAAREGVCFPEGATLPEWCQRHRFPEENFRSLWEYINGVHSWQQNPWVWCIDFEVLSTTGRPNLNLQTQTSTL